MESSLIPGLDLLNLSAKQTEHFDSSDSQPEFNFLIFRDNFSISSSISNGNCRPLDEFRKDKVLKEGHIECFYQCEDLRKKMPVTVVRYKKSKSLDEELKDFLRELEIVRNLKHFNILQHYETISCKWANVYLVYEPCSCFLSDLITKEVKELYQLPVIKTVMLQLFEALNYIHEHSIMHRNIQPSNIAISENGCLKVCNFRNARWLWDKDTSIQTEEVRYQSPELLMQTKLCGTPVDIWSAACILVELLIQKPFFEENDVRHTLKEIFSIFGFPTEISWPEFFKIPESSFFYYIENHRHSYNCLDLYLSNAGCRQTETTMDLLQSMFNLNPKMRFSANECSGHIFFSNDPKASTSDSIEKCVKIALERQPKCKETEM